MILKHESYNDWYERTSLEEALKQRDELLKAYGDEDGVYKAYYDNKLSKTDAYVAEFFLLGHRAQHYVLREIYYMLKEK